MIAATVCSDDFFGILEGSGDLNRRLYSFVGHKSLMGVDLLVTSALPGPTESLNKIKQNNLYYPNLVGPQYNSNKLRMQQWAGLWVIMSLGNPYIHPKPETPKP